MIQRFLITVEVAGGGEGGDFGGKNNVTYQFVDCDEPSDYHEGLISFQGVQVGETPLRKKHMFSKARIMHMDVLKDES